jgi:hypothetical protein
MTTARRARTMTMSRGVKDTPQSQTRKVAYWTHAEPFGGANYRDRNARRRQRTVPIDLRRESRGKPV